MKTLWQGRRIPLSWLLLSRQPVRLLVALAGISFAGILMFMQLGFRDGLFDASVTVHRLFDADLVLISPRSPVPCGWRASPGADWSRPWPIPPLKGSARSTGA